MTASRSIQFANTGVATTLTLGAAGKGNNVLANSNGGGAIVISNNDTINVGSAGNNNVIQGNSVNIFNTGTTNSSDINVVDGTTVTGTLGSVTITAGTSLGGNLTVGVLGGAGVKINSTAGSTSPRLRSPGYNRLSHYR